ncbi:MAG: acyl carrier protein [Candidatus Omnitrophica bacterium]|nr:acyl carrier protein [Candidatus Omnitrophota bacterium]
MAKPAKDIEKEVIQILAEKLDLDVEKIKPESKLMEDLGMDSFMSVEFTFELKEKFDIDISPEEFSNVKKVEDVTKKIASKETK